MEKTGPRITVPETKDILGRIKSIWQFYEVDASVIEIWHKALKNYTHAECVEGFEYHVRNKAKAPVPADIMDGADVYLDEKHRAEFARRRAERGRGSRVDVVSATDRWDAGVAGSEGARAPA